MAQTFCDWLPIGLLVTAAYLTIRMYFGHGDD